MKTSFLLAALLFSAVTVASAQKIAFSFADGSLSDLSGNMHDAVPVGTPGTAEDRFGNPTCAYSFPGTPTDYLYIPFHSDFDIPATGALSISLWYKGGSPGVGDFETLFGKGSVTASAPKDYHIALYDLNRPSFGSTYSPVLMPQAATPYASSINGWNHLVAIYDNEQWVLFINNVRYTTAMTATINQSGEGIIIGRNFTGSIDDIVFYDRAITANEVTRLYEQDNFSCQTEIGGLPTGVGESESDRMDFIVGVHPDNQTITVEHTAPAGTQYPYQIVDMAGRLLHSGYLRSASTTISIQDMPVGAYLLRVGDTHRQVFKFIRE